MKDHLKYLDIDDTKISDKDRLDLMAYDTVSVSAGSSTEKVLAINGLLKGDDEVEVEDPEIADAEVIESVSDDEYRYDTYNCIVLTANKGQEGKSTKLTITSSDGTSREIKVNITAREENVPGFKEQSMEASIGKFSEIEFKNMTDDAQINIDPESENEDIVGVETEEDYDEELGKTIKHCYLVPKSEGTATITVQCKVNGTTYDDTMEVTVGKADDDNAPIKDYGLYKAINLNLDNELQSDHITKSTMATIKTITAKKRDITDLSGIECATECKKIDLSGNKGLTDISALKGLTKLENVNLSSTKVSDVSALENIKNQLTNLNLKSTKVSATDRLSFINDSQTMSVEAGTKKEVEVKPTGILEKQDQCRINGDSTVKVSNNGNGKVTIDAQNAKEGEEASFTITNSNAGNSEVTIPIHVTKRADDIPAFKNKSETISIGDLHAIEFENDEDDDLKISVKSKDTSIVSIDGYSYEPHFVPKSKGSTTIDATFKKKDGTTYTDTMTVTVEDASEDIAPIKSWNTFKMLIENNDVEIDGECKFTKDQMKQIKKICLSSTSKYTLDEQISGLDWAENCEEFIVEDTFDYTDIKSLVEQYDHLKSTELENIDIDQEEFNDFLDKNKYLEKLEINFEDFSVTDFSKIKELTNLKDLNLANSELEDFSILTDLTNLESLSLYNSKIKNIDGIDKLSNLKKLYLSYVTGVKDFDLLSKLGDLEILYLNGTNIKTVEPLKNLKKLQVLNLEDTRVKAKDRMSLLKVKEAKLEENETNKVVFSPDGLVNPWWDDEVVLEDKDKGIKITDKDSSGVVLSAGKNSAGATTNILIKYNGVVYVKIPVTVVSEKEGTPGFRDKEKTIYVSQFEKIELKNMDNVTACWLEPEDESDEEIIDVVTSQKDGYRFVPKKAGVATLVGHFEVGDNGQESYEKTLKVIVKEAPENVVPITNGDIYLSLVDDNGESVDTDDNGMIDNEEIKKVTDIRANYSHVEDKDFEYLTKAINCKKMDLSDNKDLTDLSFISNFKYLKEINLDGDEKISDYKPLVDHKTQFDTIILPAQAPDSVRKELITTDDISLKEGQKATEVIHPSGLLKDTDTVSVEDQDIAEAKIVPNDDEDSIVGEYLEETGKKEGTTKLTIHMGSETKEINIKVTKQNTEEIIKFADGSENVKESQFKSYNFVNVKASDIKKVDFEYDNDDVLEMIENKDHSYTPVALKGSGKVTVSAEITLNNGVKETVEAKEFSVEPADQNAVIIRDYDLYKGMLCNKQSADTNKDGIISKAEIEKVDEITVKNSYIDDLTGAEKATNCTKVDFDNDGFLNDISALASLGKLTSINLRGTSVRKIDALSKLEKLDYVCLDDSDVTENDKLSLLRLKDMTVTEDKTQTQEIKPSGILANTVDVKSDSDNVEAKIVDGKLEVTGKSEGEATLTIGNKGKQATRTIKVTVQKKQEESKPDPKPNPTKPGDNKPQTPSQNQTKVEKITVTAPSTKLAAGKKVKLTANISNNASNKNIKWSTSNSKYATVDQNGVVTFNKKAGGKTVTITAMATDGSGKKTTFKVKIMKGVVKKITISGKKSVKAGKTLKLKAKVKASKGANKKLTWTSSNTKYATVSSSGKVKALKAGKKKSVKITAMATDGSGKKATVTIKIK